MLLMLFSRRHQPDLINTTSALLVGKHFTLNIIGHYLCKLHTLQLCKLQSAIQDCVTPVINFFSFIYEGSMSTICVCLCGLLRLTQAAKAACLPRA